MRMVGCKLSRNRLGTLVCVILQKVPYERTQVVRQGALHADRGSAIDWVGHGDAIPR